ncbi:MAG: hypothetical protein JNJ61_02195 [Anaerolineae bacterium]|nr:hypothetical protein [Anaerolineae bacterium]
MTQDASLSVSPAPLRLARWLLLTLLFVAIFQANAAWRALNIPDDLTSLVSLSRPLEFSAAGIWALFALLAAGFIWRRRAGALRFGTSILAGFSIYSVLRLFLYVSADYDRGRLPFLLVLVCIPLIALAAARLRSRLSLKKINGDDRHD